MAVDISYDIELGTTAIVDDGNQASRQVLNDTNPEMFVPHAVNTYIGLSEPLQNLRPRSIQLENNLILDMKLVDEKAELVHSSRVIIIPNTTKEDQFNIFGSVSTGLDKLSKRLLKRTK